jgi:hypothetical protein
VLPYHLEIISLAKGINLHRGINIQRKWKSKFTTIPAMEFIITTPTSSGKHIHNLSATCYSPLEILCFYFWLLVIVYDVLSCFLFGLVLYCKLKSCWKHLTHHIPTLFFPFKVALSNTLSNLLILYFPPNYFWLSYWYVVWLAVHVPKDGFSTN